jgi:hypothetical protein
MAFGERVREEAMKLTLVPEVLAELQRKGVVSKLQETLELAFEAGEERKPGFRESLKLLLGVMGRS